LKEMRRHRIDMNLIYDHNPEVNHSVHVCYLNVILCRVS
jgi:hypothetical protein